jgi:hypothetical protein
MIMIAWEITARWVLQNGKFVLSVPCPRGYEISKIATISLKIEDLQVEGILVPKPKEYLNYSKSTLPLESFQKYSG